MCRVFFSGIHVVPGCCSEKRRTRTSGDKELIGRGSGVLFADFANILPSSVIPRKSLENDACIDTKSRRMMMHAGKIH